MKLTTLILTLTASLAFGGFSIAQETEEKKPERPARPEGAGEKGKGKGKGGRPGGGAPGGGIAEIVKRLDKDGNGSITREEAGEDAWARIGRMDKNEDGVIGSDEIPQGRPGGGSPGGGQRNFGPEVIARIFDQTDTNKDGKISAEEAGERWERMSAADTNKDGGVDKEEFGKMVASRMREGGKGGPGGGGRPSPDQMFAQADADKDGKISKEEAGERWQFLSRMDANEDGALTKEELEKGFAEMRARFGGKGKGKGDGKGGPGGAGRGGGGGQGQIFDRFDKDKDGKLSKEEVPEEMWARLSNADEDADGLISKAELEKVFAGRQGGGDGKGKGKGDGKGKGKGKGDDA